MQNLHWAIQLRLLLLRPYDCEENAVIRDVTAWLEEHGDKLIKKLLN